ncbi:MAG: deacetylase [Pusillimonas sp.]|jgi:acetoin utilization deacetylase AcuC-like enzyme|nr:deacetylase [Pusillimonas sp.]
MQTLYITHPACHLHEMGNWHPECPERLDAINDQFLASGIEGLLQPCRAREATDADLLRVHSAEHINYLKKHVPLKGYFEIDPDTYMNPHTLQAALAAAGAGLTAVDEIMSQQAQNAFCAVRPPGHHARPNQAMGFCFFNNIGVTVAYALEKFKLGKVAIIDFDVHHGNGTAEMFANDPRVLMCGFYQNLIFPNVHTENKSENMLNIPVEAYATGDVVRKLVSDHWLPRLQAFEPEFIFVSAGFDAHREDDLAQLGLVENDYAWITEQLVAQAEKSAQGRIVSFLEGGYNLSALGRSAVAHVKALAKL